MSQFYNNTNYKYNINLEYQVVDTDYRAGISLAVTVTTKLELYPVASFIILEFAGVPQNVLVAASNFNHKMLVVVITIFDYGPVPSV